MTEQTLTQKSFLGVPVTGDINATETRAEQKPIEDLAPLFQAVLNDELIVEFGWNQYTPYFNDGDPCMFRVGSPWFRTVNDEIDEDDDYQDTLGVDYGTHPTLGRFEFDYQGVHPVEKSCNSEHESTLRACRALSDAMGSDAFDDVLQANFGDHAQIVVRRDGIEVETYEHD